MVSTKDFASKFNLILMAFGIFGNFLCIYVFTRKEMNSRKLNWYLLVLAIAELVFCLVLFIDYTFSLLNEARMTLHEFNTSMKIVIDLITHSADSFSGIVTLLISIDRLYAIMNPIEIRNFITNLHAKLLVNLLLVSLILLKIFGVAICNFYNTHIFLIFCTIISPILYNIIPTFIILVINSILIVKVLKYYRSKKAKSFFNTSLQRRINSTQASHFFLIIFLALWLSLTTLPYYLIKTFSLFYQIKNFSLYFKNFNQTKLMVIQIISSILFNSNHCINFFFYLYFYPMFRKILFNFSK